MKEYTVKKVSSPLTLEDERWEKIEYVELSEKWENLFPTDYSTKARLAYSDEGLYLRMETKEWPVVVKISDENQEVCLDSCMEFFLTPNMTDEIYVNIEANAHAVPLCGIGSAREGRKGIRCSSHGVVVKTAIEFKSGWTLFEFIPFDFLRKYFTSIDKEMRANFYKCGDESAVEHYTVWNKVETEEPDYHRPEYFGKLLLSEQTL